MIWADPWFWATAVLVVGIVLYVLHLWGSDIL